MSSNFSSSSSSSSLNSITNGGAVNYIEHHVSKMDTLAGVAIKYGVEVADIKRMNGLVTDLQMFALNSLQIPLPGRHPPSASLSNGLGTPGESVVEQTPHSRGRSDVLETLQSLRFKKPQRRVSPAMSSLQGYYGLKSPNHKSLEEGTEMAVYKTGRAHYLQDETLQKISPASDTSPSQHMSRSLVNMLENDEPLIDLAFPDSRDGETEKSNEKSVRRRQKADADLGSRTPEKVLKEESNGGSGFSASTGRGLALRPKSVSRNLMAADSDISWLNPIPVGLGDSLMADGFVAVRKSSSTSNLQDQDSNGSSSIWPTTRWSMLQDQDSNGSSSIWPTTRWSMKPDLQALSSATSITRPIFDGLPKPVSGRRNKAALD